MTLEMAQKLRKSLVLHEGYKKFPYADVAGNITIGIGHNLTAHGETDEYINSRYQQDVEYFYSKLIEFDWFNNLNSDRKIVLIDMCFNLGFKNFMGFENMISALEQGDCELASKHMLDSDAAKKVNSRYQKLAQGLNTGVYHV